MKNVFIFIGPKGSRSVALPTLQGSPQMRTECRLLLPVLLLIHRLRAPTGIMYVILSNFTESDRCRRSRTGRAGLSSCKREPRYFPDPTHCIPVYAALKLRRSTLTVPVIMDMGIGGFGMRHTNYGRSVRVMVVGG